MLIFGFRSRAKKVSDGMFFCPRCGADRAYVLQQFRRWFTLFFLPIFPIGKLGSSQVKCQTCKSAFTPAVLQTPTSAALSDSMRNALRIASIAVLSAGNPGSPAARQRAVQAIAAAGLEGYSDAALAADLGQIQASQLAPWLAQVASGLNDKGKESFLGGLVRIAVADGQPSEPASRLLYSIGATLGLSAPHVLGIITAALNFPRQAVQDRPQDSSL